MVRRGLDAHTIFRGLAQELALAYLEKNEVACASQDFAVYSAAYFLCKRSGIPVGSFSFQRMPKVYQGMDSQSLWRKLGAIREVAGDVSLTINCFLSFGGIVKYAFTFIYNSFFKSY